MYCHKDVYNVKFVIKIFQFELKVYNINNINERKGRRK